MANLKSKDIKSLQDWNTKELRKLRMTIRNRISSFESEGKAKDLPDTHPLSNLDVSQCQDLLKAVIEQEKK